MKGWLVGLVLLMVAVPLVAQTGDLPRKDGIVTRPVGTRGTLPAVFLAKWVSCGSVELSDARPSEVKEIAVRSGLAMIRVERAGEGDSEGPACGALDYDTEVRHYREAFDQLSRHRWVDPDRIIIFGSSLGSTTAPLIAQGKKVAGIIVQGGGAVTYLERMINFDRLNLERSGAVPVDRIHDEMLKRIEFQGLYLRDKRTPEQIAVERPHLAGVWPSLLGSDAKPHYGRPYAWHWQAADKDFLAAWTTIRAPVMVVYAEYDQFESRHGHRLIVDTINRLRPGTATWLEIEKAGHDLLIYSSPETAYRFEGGQSQPELFVQPAIAWLRKVADLAPLFAGK